MEWNGNSGYRLSECAASLTGIIQFEGALASAPDLHVLDAGLRAAIQRLCNPI
jgi:hypothetical protein